MGIKKDVTKLGDQIMDTIENDVTKVIPYKKYIAGVFLLVALFFLYRKFGAQLFNKPKKYF